jgi:cytochrome c oxidase subunit 2
MSRFYILFLCLLAAGGCNQAPNPIPGGIRRIDVIARKYAFEPAKVRVRLGETVVLHISTSDVQHGFAVPDLNIRESIQPGFPADITFHATRAGHFRIDCYIKCGPGHDDMEGEIVVE